MAAKLFFVTFLICNFLFVASSGWTTTPKEDPTPLNKKEFFKPELALSSSNVPMENLRGQLSNQTGYDRFLRKHGSDFHIFLDPRSGTATNILGPIPFIPGTGAKNTLKKSDSGAKLGRSVDKINSRVIADLMNIFMKENQMVFGIDVSQLGKVDATQVTDTLWQINIPQVVKGVPVRDARFLATINYGNIIMMGSENWGNVKVDTIPKINSTQALEIGFKYVGGRASSDQMWKDPTLEILPAMPPNAQSGEAYTGPVGEGYSHYLVWTFGFVRPPELARWEVIVDAHSGELLAFVDKNQYVDKRIAGNVYPLTSTEICPSAEFCGIMQNDFPMPFTNTGLAAPHDFTNSAGVFEYSSGTVNTTLSGRFVRISDVCGAINQSSTTGDLLLGGANAQHDCAVPLGSSAGNTASARSAFYEINKIAEQARGWLPTNVWLNNQLTANVNINLTCNGFWNGATVNFYRAGGGCRNTGEIAGVFDHEWGHGMDDNDAAGNLSNSSEGYADIAAIYRYQSSCIGYGFFATQNRGCGQTADLTGFNMNEDQVGGSHCDTNCSGVRDADWARHANNTPDTPQNFSCVSCLAGPGPCGRQVHCTAAPVRQAAWDLVSRDLPAAPFNANSNTAFMIGNKVFYQGSGNVGAWHACGCPNNSDGCGAANGYMQWLAADDDNGNVNDGTPHMTAIFNAFNRHNIACAAPNPVNSGCAGAPSTAPANLTATPGDNQISLSWDAVPGAARYWVLRTEGHAGCNYGKALIADPTGTSYVDTEVVNGRTYFYNVVAVAPSNSCFGPAQPNCASATPPGGQPQIQVPGNISIGAICVGTASTETLNVCSTGKADLLVTSITSSNPSFSVTTPTSGFPVTISPDFCFPFQVAFNAGSAGSQSATLTISSNDPVTPNTTVTVSGDGSQPDIRVTGSTDFGIHSAWTPAEKRISVCNTGACDLSVTSAAVACPDFTLINNPFPAKVSPDSCLDLVVRFTPVEPYSKSCDLTITSNDPDSPTVVRTLTGKTPPLFSVHGGLVIPHGSLDNIAKLGSAINVDFVYPFTDEWAWDLRFGFSRFDGEPVFPDIDLTTLGANLRFMINPSGTVRVFLNGGGGMYHFNPGDFEAGFNVGAGLNIPVGRRFQIEGTYNFHLAFTASPTLRFSQIQGGLLVSF